MEEIKHIYLAGPFFNPVQRNTMQELADFCEKEGINYYWPLEHAKYLPPDASQEEREEVFHKEVEAIRSSSYVLSWLDWALPADLEVRTLRYPEIGVPCVLHEANPSAGAGTTKHCGCIIRGIAASPALNLPDAGTVFETAVAYSAGIPVVGWTTKPKAEARVNLMLAVALLGLSFGLKTTENWLRTRNHDLLEKYSGRII